MNWIQITKLVIELAFFGVGTPMTMLVLLTAIKESRRDA